MFNYQKYNETETHQVQISEALFMMSFGIRDNYACVA